MDSFVAQEGLPAAILRKPKVEIKEAQLSAAFRFLTNKKSEHFLFARFSKSTSLILCSPRRIRTFITGAEIRYSDPLNYRASKDANMQEILYSHTQNYQLIFKLLAYEEIS